MKISFKPLISLSVLISLALLSCGELSSEIPATSNKVVSYKKLYIFDSDTFITDKDTLKAWFPHIFEEEQAECNYFAINFGGISSTLNTYWILSEYTTLHKITPTYKRCPMNDDAIYHSMLICDDTAEGNLKDKIDTSYILNHTDSGWDCRDYEYSKKVFF